MTREDAIRWMTVLKQSKINWIGDTNKIADIKVECEKAEQEAFDMAIEALSADAVQVVRCKDCKYRARFTVCDALAEDGYCSLGERKGGDDE